MTEFDKCPICGHAIEGFPHSCKVPDTVAITIDYKPCSTRPELQEDSAINQGVKTMMEEKEHDCGEVVRSYQSVEEGEIETGWQAAAQAVFDAYTNLDKELRTHEAMANCTGIGGFGITVLAFHYLTKKAALKIVISCEFPNSWVAQAYSMHTDLPYGPNPYSYYLGVNT